MGLLDAIRALLRPRDARHPASAPAGTSRRSGAAAAEAAAFDEPEATGKRGALDRITRRVIPLGPTQLLPRMVARIGPTRFASPDAAPDFLDDLPELRPLDRVAPSDEAEQVAQLLALVKPHAERVRPEPASYPALAVRVMDVAQDPNARVEDIVDMVARDPAVSAALLKVCNSALYSRGGQPVLQLLTAVGQVGLDEVCRIAAGVASRSLFDLEVVSEFQLFSRRFSDVFHRSMTVAWSAGWLATKLKRKGPERAFLGGMFHDLGKTTALRSLCAQMMAGKVPFAPDEGAIDRVVEQLHVELGAIMLQSWSMPEEMVRICRLHHAHELPAGPDAPDLGDLHVVRLCAALEDLQSAPALHPEAAETVRQSVRALGLTFKQYRLLTAKLGSFREQVSVLFGIGGSGGIGGAGDEKLSA